jgi:CrcB protein
MGVVAALVETVPSLPPAIRLLLATGILGGFTTFSAFALDTMQALDRGAYGTALAYAGLSVLGSVAALAFGRAVTRALL